MGELGCVSRAAGGQDQALVIPREQLLAQVILQLRDVPADCAVRDAQLVGGGGHALVPRDGFERTQRIQWGQPASHAVPCGVLERQS